MNQPSTAPEPFLAIDTASPVVTVALGSGNSCECVELAVGESSELLLDTVASLLAKYELEVRDLRGVLCTAGPGSFTGLRIGMATVLGLEASCNVPVVALPTLWVQAASTALDSASLRNDGLDVISALPAHRGQWYVQRFSDGDTRTRGPIATVSELGSEVEAPHAPIAAVISSSVSILEVEALSPHNTYHSGPLAVSLVKLAAANPPNHAALFQWDSATLTKPLYAHTPAVSARPRTSIASTTTPQPLPER